MTLQVAVPVAAFADGVPSRFGFHMFSGHAEPLEVRVLDRSGAEVATDIDDFVASGRGEIDWSRRLPAFICARLEGAAVVTVTSRGRTRSLTCVAR